MRSGVSVRMFYLTVLLMTAGAAAAQVPADPHGTLSPVLPVPGGAATAPVAPDTATVVMTLPEGSPAPERIIVRPDSLVFGGIVEVILDPETDLDGSVAVLEHDTPWLEAPVPEKTGRVARLLGQGAPAPAPNTFRVYRIHPFRIQVGGALSEVIHVQGRAGGTGEVASIRTPPFPGWPWPAILGGALVLVLLVLLAMWLWGRRHGPVVWPDRPVGTPAWLDAATGLDALIQGGSLARGEGSHFLDGLAHLARRYMAGRYGVAAAEMTSREIVTACRALGYPLGPVRALAGLIDEADRRRYDPEPPLPAWCREQAIGFFVQVQSTRVLPRQSPVEPARVLAAEKAWTTVARELDPTGRLSSEQNRGGAS